MQGKETESKGAGMTTQEMCDGVAAAAAGMAAAAEFEQMIQKAAKAAVAEYKRQEEKDKKRDKYHNTFMLLKCYRDAAFHVENAISDGTQLALAGMTDEQQRTYLESVRRRNVFYAGHGLRTDSRGTGNREEHTEALGNGYYQ